MEQEANMLPALMRWHSAGSGVETRLACVQRRWRAPGSGLRRWQSRFWENKAYVKL